MNYEHFSADDFAADQDFIQWVLAPGAPDRQFWEQWIKDHPHKEEVLREAFMIVRSVEFPHHPYAYNAALNVWQRICATNSREAVKRSSRKGRAKLLIAGSVATTLLFIATFVFYFPQRYTNTYQTTFGETQTIELPDGSSVVLNANSTLHLGEQWNNDREVWLDGEAFFSVKKKDNPSKPGSRFKFTVHTNTLDVDVLGTEFTVSERSKTTVVLNSGKISLTLPEENAKSILMEPGDMVEVRHGKSEVIHRNVRPELYSAWKDRTWILDGFTLEQIAGRITETFGLRVVIKNHVNVDTEVTGVVPVDNLNTLLKALSAAFDRKFVRRGERVIIE